MLNIINVKCQCRKFCSFHSVLDWYQLNLNNYWPLVYSLPSIITPFMFLFFNRQLWLLHIWVRSSSLGIHWAVWRRKQASIQLWGVVHYLQLPQPREADDLSGGRWVCLPKTNQCPPLQYYACRCNGNICLQEDQDFLLAYGRKPAVGTRDAGTQFWQSSQEPSKSIRRRSRKPGQWWSVRPPLQKLSFSQVTAMCWITQVMTKWSK